MALNKFRFVFHSNGFFKIVGYAMLYQNRRNSQSPKDHLKNILPNIFEILYL